MKDSATVSMKNTAIQKIEGDAETSKHLDISKESKTNVKSLKNFYKATDNDDQLSFEDLPELKHLLLYLRTGDNMGFKVDSDMEIISIDKNGPAFDNLKIGYVIRTVNKKLVKSYEQFMQMLEHPGLYHITSQKQHVELPKRLSMILHKNTGFVYKVYCIKNNAKHRNMDICLLQCGDKFLVKDVPNESIFVNYLVKGDRIIPADVKLTKNVDILKHEILTHLNSEYNEVCLTVERAVDEFRFDAVKKMMKGKELNCCLRTFNTVSKKFKKPEASFHFAEIISEIYYPFVYFGITQFEIDYLLKKTGDYLVVIGYESEKVVYILHAKNETSIIQIKFSKNQNQNYAYNLNNVNIITRNMEEFVEFMIVNVLKMEALPFAINVDKTKADVFEA